MKKERNRIQCLNAQENLNRIEFFIQIYFNLCFPLRLDKVLQQDSARSTGPGLKKSVFCGREGPISDVRMHTTIWLIPF